MQLDFKPLDHAPWIMNAVVPVTKHTQLSVSYNGSEGMWYAGDKGDYEVAIQVIDPDRYPGVASLVSFKDNPSSNVFPHTKDSGLPALAEKAKQLVYHGAIEVFAERGSDKEKTWGVRFLCAKGYDFQSKLGYTRGVFGAGNYRLVHSDAAMDDKVNELRIKLEEENESST